MNVTQALDYIHSVSWKGSVPGLSRTQELLRRIGNPEKKLKFIHIAGTNGKGSTAAMLASILRQAGYTTGLYTSPYILRFHERMQVNGQEITDGELSSLSGPMPRPWRIIPQNLSWSVALALSIFCASAAILSF